MAKKQRDENEEARRRSRKEILLERRRRRQTRQIRIAVAGVVAVLALVLIAAVVIEFVVRPNQPVATVNGTDIALVEWQDRVRYQRAQFIILLEDQLEAFQDVSLVQQFSQQQISLLQQPELLGQLVLEQMVDEELIRQAALERGLSVTDEDVEERIAEQFDFYGGAAPTPSPTPSPTIEPTPSLTPIPTEVITEVLPTNTPFPTPTLGPSRTPAPSPTPVSEEAFQQSYEEFLNRYQALGVGEDAYRSVIRAQLYREKLADHLAEAQDLPEEAEMASIYTLAVDGVEEAEQLHDRVQGGEYLPVWNEVRSALSDAENAPAATAGESVWRTQEQLEQQYGPQVAEAAFELPIGEPSEVLTQTVQAPSAAAGQDEEAAQGTEEQTRYYVIQVSGREVRDLSQSAIENRKQELVSELVAEQRQGGLAQIQTFPLWRARVPRQPLLDPQFLVAPPTEPAPLPTQPLQPAPTSGESGGN